jgi:succinyl-CoA synthetase beta subunit
MNILEFQSKILCREFGIPVPESTLLTSIHPIKNNQIDLKYPLVMKAQVPLHKRARRGGICLARSSEEAVSMLSSMFIRKIDDHYVNRILVEEMIEFHSGFAVSLQYNKSDFSIILSVSESLPLLEGNGVKADQDKNELRYRIDPYLGILDSTIAEIAALLALDVGYWKNFKNILNKLWDLFSGLDLEYLEVNPLVVREDSQFFVLGIDIKFDDHALFRHPEINRFFDSGLIEELENSLYKLDYGYTRDEGNCCVISTSMEMCAAIRDILISAGHDASELISLNGNITSERVTQLLRLVENEKRSELIIFHMIGDPDIDARVLEELKNFQTTSQYDIPIVARISGNELISQPKLEKSDHLIFVNSLAEIPDVLKASMKGKI